MAKSLKHAGALRVAYEQMFTLATCFGCTLNNQPARLDVSPRSGLALVKTVDGTDQAVFNWSVAALVMKERKGAFLTRGNEAPLRRWSSNPLLALV